MAPSEDMRSFREVLHKAKHVVVLTGAGVSAESGVPTFRGPNGGFWRKHFSIGLANPDSFAKNPGLVWEFYHYRRELVLTKKPNPAHYALAECEKLFGSEGKQFTLITQNVDELHRKAGSENIIEMHGSLFRTICRKCHHEKSNYDSPICEGLRDKGSADLEVDPHIPEEDLPHCKETNCGGLLRPGVVWFGESMKEEDMEKIHSELDKCDLFLVVGTSAQVYPAAGFGSTVAHRHVPVAEFNIEENDFTGAYKYYFQGPCGKTLPEALAPK